MLNAYFGLTASRLFCCGSLILGACTATTENDRSADALGNDTVGSDTVAQAADARWTVGDGAYRETAEAEAFVPLNAPEARPLFVAYQGPAATFVVTHTNRVRGATPLPFTQPSTVTLQVSREAIIAAGAGSIQIRAIAGGRTTAELAVPVRAGSTQCNVDCARGDFSCLVQTRALCAASPFGDTTRRREVFADRDELAGMLAWLNESSARRPIAVTRQRDEIVVEFASPVPNLRAVQQIESTATRSENVLQIQAEGARYSIRGFSDDDGLPIVLDWSTSSARMDPTQLYFIDLFEVAEPGAEERGCRNLGLDGTLHVDTSWTYNVNGPGNDSDGTRIEAPLAGVMVYMNSTIRAFGEWIPFVPWNSTITRTDANGHVRATVCRYLRDKDRLLDVKYLFHDHRALVGQQDPWTLATELVPGGSTLYFDATGLDGTVLPSAQVRDFGTLLLTTTGDGSASTRDARAATVFFFATTLEKLWMDNGLGNRERLMPIHALYPARISIDYPSLFIDGFADPVFGKVHLRDSPGYGSLRWRTVAHEMTHIWQYDHGPNNVHGFLAAVITQNTTHPCQASPGVAFLEGMAESMVDEYFCSAFGVADCRAELRAQSRDELSIACRGEGLLLTEGNYDHSDLGVEGAIRALTIPTVQLMRAQLSATGGTTVDGNTFEVWSRFGTPAPSICNQYLGAAVRWQDVLHAYRIISGLGGIVLQSQPMWFLTNQLRADTNRSAEWLAFRRTYALWDVPTVSPAEACMAMPPAPTCTDNVQNGSETGVDCGGACAGCLGGPCTPLGCVAGATCLDDLCLPPPTTCRYNNMNYGLGSQIYQMCNTHEGVPGRSVCVCTDDNWDCEPCQEL